MITNTREILHTTTADKNDTVFLQGMAFARDIGGHFKTVGQTNTGNLTKSRIRLLRGCGTNVRADTTLLRSALSDTGTALVAGIVGIQLYSSLTGSFDLYESVD